MTIALPEQRSRRLEATPLTRAIEFQLDTCAEGRATATLPQSPQSAADETSGHIHGHAIITLLDHLAGYAVASRVPGDVGISTMQFQISFTGAQPKGALSASAECRNEPCASTLVSASAMDARGALIAVANGWFAVGAFPGGQADASKTGEPLIDLGAVSGPFHRLIGLSHDQERGLHIAPGTLPAIGWIGLPALHGGAIAALLAAAAEERIAALGRSGLSLASLTVQYLRAAAASEPLISRAECDWPGRRAAHVSARAFGPDGKDRARGQAFFASSAG